MVVFVHENVVLFKFNQLNKSFSRSVRPALVFPLLRYLPEAVTTILHMGKRAEIDISLYFGSHHHHM